MAIASKAHCRKYSSCYYSYRLFPDNYRVNQQSGQSTLVVRQGNLAASRDEFIRPGGQICTYILTVILSLTGYEGRTVHVAPSETFYVV
jgi:hypothetical protein